MEKITVIMPIYNTEEYLREAIESVISQTYTNLEIILVDDGSTDSSPRICDEYAKEDNRIKVVHQKNMGLSGARNTGLKNATGQYLMFIDSDDKFEIDTCKILYNKAKQKDADFIIANYINIDEDGKKWEKPIFSVKYKETELSIKECEKSFYLMNSSVCNKIFKKSFIDSLGIKFIEKLPAEDAIFTTYCFVRARKVYYIPDIIYEYRQRYKDSISHSCTKQYFDGINKAYRIIYENFKDNEQIQYYRYFYAKSIHYMLHKLIDSIELSKEQKIEVLKEMKWFYDLGLEINVPTSLKSVKYIVESIHEEDYEQAIKYCEIIQQLRSIIPDEYKEKMSKPNMDTYK